MEKRKVTYAALEKMTGLSSQTITRARGELIRECRLSTLESIAKALGVSISELFEETHEG
jgi:DNA-binding Xre family transcriptional regulator